MAQPALDPIHLPVVGLVVIARQVQHAVQNQQAKFLRQRASEAASVAASGLQGDGNIAEIRRRGRRGSKGTTGCSERSSWAACTPLYSPLLCGKPLSLFLCRSDSPPPSHPVSRERQHVRGTALASEGMVEARHGRVAKQADGYGVCGQPQRVLKAPQQTLTRFYGHRDAALAIDAHGSAWRLLGRIRFAIFLGRWRSGARRLTRIKSSAGLKDR